MKVIEPGHIFKLPHIESDGEEVLVFLRRDAANDKDNHAGTNVQEVLRALISRTKYMDAQVPAIENDDTLWHLRMALMGYEGRAYRRKMDKVNRGKDSHFSFRERDKDLPFGLNGFWNGPDIMIEDLPTGPDGHILIP